MHLTLANLRRAARSKLPDPEVEAALFKVALTPEESLKSRPAAFLSSAGTETESPAESRRDTSIGKKHGPHAIQPKVLPRQISFLPSPPLGRGPRQVVLHPERSIYLGEVSPGLSDAAARTVPEPGASQVVDRPVQVALFEVLRIPLQRIFVPDLSPDFN